ncbi:alpha/beta hydrolase [Mycobacterium sp. AMU20-3851]|uniref:alpha/beta fold hydrolase n=1 Tax=Mycobacterium sp. AMU20-3851 TaxID=3122055 RepID=UPI00375442F2
MRTTTPGLVLIHGGGHAADCWDLTVDAIGLLAPEIEVLAVDLPGRRTRPGDLHTVTIANWAESVVRDIDTAGLGEVVLVAHSLGGLTAPGVAARLGAERVREMVFAASHVPPEGRAVVDTLSGLGGMLVRRRGRNVPPGPTPRWWATYAYTNGMTRSQRTFSLDRLVDESSGVIHEAVSRADMPGEVPRTWILTSRDRALSPRCQRKSIAALGGVQTLIEIDTCHNLMISEPERLAELLVERCRRY